MARRKVIKPRPRHKPETDWLILITSAALTGIVTGSLMTVALPKITWDTRGAFLMPGLRSP